MFGTNSLSKLDKMRIILPKYSAVSIISSFPLCFVDDVESSLKKKI